jgi:organic hydroperoxide reductase OsmC/OhrA
MEPYPHHYEASASAVGESVVPVTSPGLPDLDNAPPPHFGGPGDKWSPETMIVASVASCFILTWRSVARASKVEWEEIACHVDGVLEKVEKVLKFTEFKIRVELKLPAGGDPDSARRAERAAEKSEKICLITNSLDAKISLETIVDAG